MPGSRSSEPVEITTTRGRGRDRDRGAADRGEQAELARAEDGALARQHVALGDVLAGAAGCAGPAVGAWLIRTWATPRSVHS